MTVWVICSSLFLLVVFKRHCFVLYTNSVIITIYGQPIYYIVTLKKFKEDREQRQLGWTVRFVCTAELQRRKTKAKLRLHACPACLQRGREEKQKPEQATKRPVYKLHIKWSLSKMPRSGTRKKKKEKEEAWSSHALEIPIRICTFNCPSLSSDAALWGEGGGLGGLDGGAEVSKVNAHISALLTLAYLKCNMVEYRI